jgi:acyl transferase domain-containing protein
MQTPSLKPKHPLHTSLLHLPPPPPPIPPTHPQVLSSVTIKEPRIPIYSNVTGQPFKGAADIAALLPRQLVEPVQWEGTIRNLLSAGEGAGPRSDDGWAVSQQPPTLQHAQAPGPPPSARCRPVQARTSCMSWVPASRSRPW